VNKRKSTATTTGLTTADTKGRPAGDDEFLMKRLRLDRWSGQLVSARTRPAFCLRQQHGAQRLACRRLQSTSAALDVTYEDGEDGASEQSITEIPKYTRRIENLPSPPPSASLRSAKLAALHARLTLPKSLPLQTLARTLVDPSADPNPQFNNAALTQVGGSLASYYVGEFLLARYPRLPMAVLFAASYAYNGPPTLQIIGREWGVETAAVPGGEIDPGLLQFSRFKPGEEVPNTALMGTTRPDKKSWMRRGISSRNVYDDEFGDVLPKEGADAKQEHTTAALAYSNFVKAVVGAIYVHAGRQAARTFVHHHLLSRYLDMSTLFRFQHPVKELARLCLREEFEYPVARILSETGRLSRTPVFVVGIFSGTEKLGEGTGPSLEESRIRAAVAALKSWYLYSPGKGVRLPSEMEAPNAKPWEPLHIDMGEVII
jgi:dsRNA-specific ribonuclease